jgi:hypothetical protein
LGNFLILIWSFQLGLNDFLENSQKDFQSKIEHYCKSSETNRSERAWKTPPIQLEIVEMIERNQRAFHDA